jgi:hypothetical protein
VGEPKALLHVFHLFESGSLWEAYLCHSFMPVLASFEEYLALIERCAKKT